MGNRQAGTVDLKRNEPATTKSPVTKMKEHNKHTGRTDKQQSTTDNESSLTDGFTINRRNAIASGAIGLAAITGLAGNAAAHHQPGHGGGSGGGGGGGDSGANQFRFAGQTWDYMYASADDDNENASEIKELLRLSEVKKSNSWQDSLTFQPSIESSLITDISLDGDEDRSQAAAGVLGWIEIRESGEGDDAWQMVTVDDDLVDPPQQSEIDEEGNLVGTTERKFNLARGVVGFNTRDFRAEWDLTEITEAIEELQEAIEYDEEEDEYEFDSDWDELFLDMYIKTRSANTFNYTKTNIPGTHDVRLMAALHVFVDDDSDYDDVQAQAIVGNRQLFVEPRKIRAEQD